jgi:hypothetical protein
MRTIVSTLLLAPLALSAVAASADCQLMASEPATVSQTVDGTRVTVTYYRPRARGRTGLFGSTIKWGETWTPGANASTRLEVSKDVTIEGQRVPKGTYSVWIAVARDNWEMLLDRDTALFHTQAPKHRAGQVRFNVSREKKPFMEALTWWIPEMSPTGMTLAMQWDTVYVPLRIKVPPSYTRTTDTEVELRAVMDPPMYSSEPGYSDWMLLPRGAGMFRLGRLQQGELVEVMDFLTAEFDSGGDRAAGFEVRLPNDNIVGKATRVP